MGAAITGQCIHTFEICRDECKPCNGSWRNRGRCPDYREGRAGQEYERAKERERERRWNADGRARVVHPKYGQVVVPHSSNYAAILNAAEYWNCDWVQILDAEVWRAGPGDGPTVRPREFCGQK